MNSRWLYYLLLLVLSCTAITAVFVSWSNNVVSIAGVELKLPREWYTIENKSFNDPFYSEQVLVRTSSGHEVIITISPCSALGDRVDGRQCFGSGAYDSSAKPSVVIENGYLNYPIANSKKARFGLELKKDNYFELFDVHVEYVDGRELTLDDRSMFESVISTASI